MKIKDEKVSAGINYQKLNAKLSICNKNENYMTMEFISDKTIITFHRRFQMSMLVLNNQSIDSLSCNNR